MIRYGFNLAMQRNGQPLYQLCYLCTLLFTHYLHTICAIYVRWHLCTHFMVVIVVPFFVTHTHLGLGQKSGFDGNMPIREIQRTIIFKRSSRKIVLAA